MQNKKADVDRAVSEIREKVEAGRDLHGAVTSMWTNSGHDTPLMEDAVEEYAKKYGS